MEHGEEGADELQRVVAVERADLAGLGPRPVARVEAAEPERREQEEEVEADGGDDEGLTSRSPRTGA